MGDVIDKNFAADRKPAIDVHGVRNVHWDLCQVDRDLSTSSWPRSSRPSTSSALRGLAGVDGRDKPGHDEAEILPLNAIPSPASTLSAGRSILLGGANRSRPPDH